MMSYYDELLLFDTVTSKTRYNNVTFYLYSLGFVKCVYNQVYNIIHDIHYVILKSSYSTIFKTNKTFDEFVKENKITKLTDFIKRNIIPKLTITNAIKCNVNHIVENQHEYIDIYAHYFDVRSLQFFKGTNSIIYYPDENQNGLYVDTDQCKIMFVYYNKINIIANDDVIDYLISTQTQNNIFVINKINNDNVEYNYGFIMYDGRIFNINENYYLFYDQGEYSNKMMCGDLLESYLMQKHDYDTCAKILNHQEIQFNDLAKFCALLIKYKKMSIIMFTYYDLYMRKNGTLSFVQVKNNHSLITFSYNEQLVTFINHRIQLYLYCKNLHEYEMAYKIIAVHLL